MRRYMRALSAHTEGRIVDETPDQSGSQLRAGDCGASCLLALISQSDKATNRASKQLAPHRDCGASCLLAPLIGPGQKQGD
jgi:hypothetical protein